LEDSGSKKCELTQEEVNAKLKEPEDKINELELEIAELEKQQIKNEKENLLEKNKNIEIISKKNKELQELEDE